MRAFPVLPPSRRPTGPVIAFVATPSTETPVAGADVTWSTNASDIGTPVSWEWDFGDGTIPVAGATPSHYFVGPGPYTVTCVVTFDDDSTATDTQVITLQTTEVVTKLNKPYTAGTVYDLSTFPLYFVTFSANTTTAPDGTTTGGTLADDNTTNVHILYLTPSTGLGTTGTYHVVFYAKAIDLDAVSVCVYQTAGQCCYLEINLSTGEISQGAGAGSYPLVGSSAYDAGGGWVRVSMSLDLVANPGYIWLGTNSAGLPYDANGQSNYAGGEKSCYIWGLHSGTGVDDYNPNTHYLGPVQTPAPTETVNILRERDGVTTTHYVDLSLGDITDANYNTTYDFDFKLGNLAFGKVYPVGAKSQYDPTVGWHVRSAAGNWICGYDIGVPLANGVVSDVEAWVYLEEAPASWIMPFTLYPTSGQFAGFSIDSDLSIGHRAFAAESTEVFAGPLPLKEWFWMGMVQGGSLTKLIVRVSDGSGGWVESTASTTALSTRFGEQNYLCFGPWNGFGNANHYARFSGITYHRNDSLAASGFATELVRPQIDNHVYKADPVGGDNTNDGVTGPWQTVARVNAMISQLGIISNGTEDVTVDSGDWSATSGHAGVYEIWNPNSVAWPFIEIDGAHVRNVRSLAQLSNTLYTRGQDAQFTSADGKKIFIKPISNPASDGRDYVISYVGSGSHLVIDTSVERFDVDKEGLRIYRPDMKVYPVEGETYVEYLAEVIVDAGDWDVTGGYTGIYETPCAESVTMVIGDGIYFEPVASLAALDAAAVGASFSAQAVEGATNATPIVITATNHGLADGTQVTITGVGGNVAANGTFTIGSATTDAFTLVGSVGNGAYTTGGTFTTGKVYIKPLTNPTSDGKVYSYSRLRPLSGPLDTIGCPVVAPASSNLWVRGVKTRHTAINNNGSYVVGDITGFSGKLLVDDVDSINTDKHAICWTINATNSLIVTRNAICDKGLGQNYTDYMTSGSGNIHEWLNCVTNKQSIVERSAVGEDGIVYYCHGGGASLFKRVTMLDCNFNNNSVFTEGASDLLELLGCEAGLVTPTVALGTFLLDTCELHSWPSLGAGSVMQNCTIDAGAGFTTLTTPRSLIGAVSILNNDFNMQGFSGGVTVAIFLPGAGLELTFTGNTVVFGDTYPTIACPLFKEFETANIVDSDNNTFHFPSAAVFAEDFDDGGGAADYTFAQWQALGYDAASTRLDPT